MHSLILTVRRKSRPSVDKYCPFSVFRDMFGEECVDFSDGKNISLTVDGKTVNICLETRVRLLKILKPA